MLSVMDNMLPLFASAESSPLLVLWMSLLTFWVGVGLGYWWGSR